jgi:hypothetical protein
MMFLDKPYVVSALALSSSLLLHISKSAVFSELERNYDIMRKMLGNLACQTHQLMLDVEGYSMLTGNSIINTAIELEASREVKLFYSIFRSPKAHCFTAESDPGAFLAHLA